MFTGNLCMIYAEHDTFLERIMMEIKRYHMQNPQERLSRATFATNGDAITASSTGSLWFYRINMLDNTTFTLKPVRISEPSIMKYRWNDNDTKLPNINAKSTS